MRRRDVLNRPRVLITTAVVLVVWGLITHGTFAGAGDEPHYMMVAHSLAFDRDLDLTNDYAAHPALIGGGRLMPENHAVPGKDGRLRPAHDIGLPLLAAPFVYVVYPLAEWIARVAPPEWMRRARLNAELVYRHIFSLLMALVTAALAVQLFNVLRWHQLAVGPAIGWTLLISLSPPVLSHSFLFFTEIPSALLAVWLYRSLTTDSLPSSRWPIVGGAIGLLLLIHVRNVALVAVFLAWSVRRLVRRDDGVDAGDSGFGRIGWFALALVLPIAVRTAAMWTFWGTVLTSPLARSATGIGLADVITMTGANLWGMLTDFNVGLLTVAPVYVLAIPGAVVAWRRSRSAAALLLTAVGLYLLTIAVPTINVHGYTGGFAPAARMILPVVPLMGILVGLAGSSAGRIGRVVVVMLLLTQFGIDLVMWNRPKRLWSGAEASLTYARDVTARA